MLKFIDSLEIPPIGNATLEAKEVWGNFPNTYNFANFTNELIRKIKLKNINF